MHPEPAHPVMPDTIAIAIGKSEVKQSGVDRLAIRCWLAETHGKLRCRS